MKRLRLFWKLAKAAWEVSSELDNCICPDSCRAMAGKDGYDYHRGSWYAGLCPKCADNIVCIRQALRRSRGEPV